MAPSLRHISIFQQFNAVLNLLSSGNSPLHSTHYLLHFPATIAHLLNMQIRHARVAAKHMRRCICLTHSGELQTGMKNTELFSISTVIYAFSHALIEAGERRPEILRVCLAGRFLPFSVTLLRSPASPTVRAPHYLRLFLGVNACRHLLFCLFWFILPTRPLVYR